MNLGFAVGFWRIGPILNSFSIIYHRESHEKTGHLQSQRPCEYEVLRCAGLKALGKMPTRGQYLFMPYCGNAGNWSLREIPVSRGKI